VALIRDVEKDLTLDELREKLVQDVDLILSEGYKKDVQPKIEIFRKEKHTELLCTTKDNLIAIVSNQTFDTGVPCFGLDDMKGLGDFIESRFLGARIDGDITLKVNGKKIPLKPFARAFLKSTIRGMLTSLKGCDSPNRIEVRIEEGSTDKI
jgi:molybdopterin-guanine dinucleotide biosynthesis protein B